MYVNSIDIDVDTRCTVMQYLRLISKRASGAFHLSLFPQNPRYLRVALMHVYMCLMCMYVVCVYTCMYKVVLWFVANYRLFFVGAIVDLLLCL